MHERFSCLSLIHSDDVLTIYIYIFILFFLLCQTYFPIVLLIFSILQYIKVFSKEKILSPQEKEADHLKQKELY